MDPLSISTAVAALVTTSTKAVVLCNTLVGKYKNAPRTLASIRTECTTVKAGLSYIYYLINRDTELFSSQMQAHGPLAETLDVALTGCTVTFSLLDCELQKLYDKSGDRDSFKWKDRMRFIWDEKVAKELLDQMRGLQSAVTLVLTALQTGSILALNKMITEQKSVVDRVRNNTMSVCQSRSNTSLGGPMTARQQQQKSFVGSYSIFDSTIGDEEFSFDDEIVKSHAYRRVVKVLMLSARARQHQDGHTAEIEDGQDPSRSKDEPTNMQQDWTLPLVNNSEKGCEMEEEKRILEERSVELASKVQEQQDELRKLQEQLRQLENRTSQTSSQEPKQDSESVSAWGWWTQDTLPVTDRGRDDSMLLTPRLADRVEDPSLSSDKQTSENIFAHWTDLGANATLKPASGTPVSTLTRGKVGTLQQEITAHELVHAKSEPSLPLKSTKNSAESSRNGEYEDLDETADGEACNTLVTSEIGSSELLRSQNTVVLPHDLGDYLDRILQIIPSEPTIEMRNVPKWLVSSEAVKSITDGINSAPPSLKLVLLGGGFCGKTSALLTYIRQTPVLVSYHNLTICPIDYHMKVLFTFQAHSEVVNVTVTDTENYPSMARDFSPGTFQDADALILGYPTGDEITQFDNITHWWLPNIREHCPAIPVVLAGMKTDVWLQRHHEEEVMEYWKDGFRFAKASGCAAFVECSSKRLETINQAFETAIRLALLNPHLLRAPSVYARFKDLFK